MSNRTSLADIRTLIEEDDREDKKNKEQDTFATTVFYVTIGAALGKLGHLGWQVGSRMYQQENSEEAEESDSDTSEESSDSE